MIKTGPYHGLGDVEPNRRLASAAGDIAGDLDEEPVLDSFCNDITVVCTDPARTPFVVHLRNDDPVSPTSTVSLQDADGNSLVIARTVEDPSLADPATARAMAQRILEESTSVYTRLTLGATPDPRFEAHEVVALDVRRDDGTVVAAGRWWWDELTIGFTPQQGTARYRCNKVLPFRQVS